MVKVILKGQFEYNQSQVADAGLLSNPLLLKLYWVTAVLCVVGNCWLLAALSCLTMHPTLFEKVVPSGQKLDGSYAGIFRFRVRQINFI